MNPFDIRTVLFGEFLTCILSTTVLFILWLRNRYRSQGIFLWVLDLAFQTTAILLVILRGKIPNWMSFELSNFLVMSGALAGLIGLERYFGKRKSQLKNYLLLAAFSAGFTYFIEFKENLPTRNIILSLALFIYSLQCTWLLYRRINPTERRTAFMVGAAFIGFCLFSLARIGIIVTLPNYINDFFQSGLYDTLILLAYQSLLILLSFGLVLMVNQNLLDEVALEEEKYSKAFCLSPYAITLTRLSDGKIIEVNDGFQTITGYGKEETIGKTTQELQLWVNAEDRTLVTSELGKGNSVRIKEFNFRIKNGKIITGLISSDIIMLEGQQWILSSIEDITEKKNAEKAIKNYSERLEEMVAERTRELELSREKLARHERLAVLGQLAGSVGHELRGPLGVMANAIYFLKISQPKADKKTQEYLNILQAEVTNADKIISDLLDFSRIKKIERGEFLIGEMIREVLKRHPTPGNIKFGFDIPENLPKPFADQHQIEQVLGNLVVNAYQSMPDGGDLTIRVSKSGKFISIAVIDTGKGIPPEIMEQLFDPLFTTKSRGIGLGLTVCKMLLSANDGKIDVKSKEGQGSVFTMYMPSRESEQ